MASPSIPNPSHLLYRSSSSRFTSGLCPSPHHKLALFSKIIPSNNRNRLAYRPLRCVVADTDKAGVATSQTAAKTKSNFEIQMLTTWLLKQEQAGNIDAELTIVLSSISIACKQIASLVQRADISNLTGIQGAVNVQGEDQKKLDVVSNEVFSNCLRSSGRTGIIASEEEDVPVAVEESYSGNYIVVFDPLDGSSNIDAAVSTGSIFGIYSPNDECLADVDEDGTVTSIWKQDGLWESKRRQLETGCLFKLYTGHEHGTVATVYIDRVPQSASGVVTDRPVDCSPIGVRNCLELYTGQEHGHCSNRVHDRVPPYPQPPSRNLHRPSTWSWTWALFTRVPRPCTVQNFSSFATSINS